MEPQRVAPGFFLLLMVYTAQLVANHDSTAAEAELGGNPNPLHVVYASITCRKETLRT